MFEKFLSLSLKKRICIISSVAVVLAAVITTGVVLAVNNPKEDIVENIPATEQTTQAAVAANDTAAEETETEEISTEIVSQVAAGSESSTKIVEEQIAAEEKKEKKQGQKKSESKNTDKKSESNEKRSDDRKNNDDSDSSSNSSGGYRPEYYNYTFDSEEDFNNLLDSLENYEEKIANKVISKAVNNITAEDYYDYLNKLYCNGEEHFSVEYNGDYIDEEEAVWAYYYCKKGYSNSEFAAYVKKVAKDYLSTVKYGDAIVIDIREDKDWAQIKGYCSYTTVPKSERNIYAYVHLSIK